MTIEQLLKNVKQPDCDFNGYLEDFLTLLKPNDLGYATFKMFYEFNPKLHICVNLHFDLAKDSKSNQIIYYKDVNKLPKHSFTCPFIIYGHNGRRAKAWILANNYPIAKGLYFALSEKGAYFENYRDDLLVCDLKQALVIKAIINQVDSHKAGYFQRIIDCKLIKDYDQLLLQARQLADQLCNKIYPTLNICDNKALVIRKAIEQWYLLKKCVYVQYMVDKRILDEFHHGDMAAQRLQAKANADHIKMIAYANLWNKYNH